MPGSATVTINDKQWAVDIAISESELATGLGGLSSIPANTGMLFDLGSPQTVEVTTEPMLFNIDIIFISEALEVVDVIEDVAPGYLVTEDTPVRYFLEVNAGEAEGIEAGDSVEITDYQYTPPSTISQWMPTIITIAMLGFIAAMVGGMARAALAPPKGLPCSRCGARIYRTGEKYYDTPAGIFCYRCVPWPYKAPEYEKVCKSPGNPEKGRKLLPEHGVAITCPICGEVIEIPEWDKVSRTEALRKHLEAKHKSEHHSMWLTLEQRKGLQEKYGAVAVRWAEEATRAGDIKGVEAAAEYYYRKLKEVFGLGHLSPVLTEEQIRKLREVLGLTASATEVLKIHRETGYIP